MSAGELAVAIPYVAAIGAALKVIIDILTKD